MVESDLDFILSCLNEPSVNTTTAERFVDYLDSGSYRPAWTWLALDGDTPVGLAVWWGFPDGDRPLALDGLWAAPSVTDPVPMWAGLIRQVPPPVEYHIFTLPDRRDDPQITIRLAAAAEAGLKTVTERFRYVWTSAQPLPERSTRLTFRAASDEEFADAFEQISVGSLDAATRAGVARISARAQALEDVDDYKSMRGPREWWRLAYDKSGALVGCALPSANDGGPVVGYVGVIPSQRGHRYADDLLSEITWMIAEAEAEAGAEAEAEADTEAGAGAATGADAGGGEVVIAVEGVTIRADTDSTNVPMVASFERLGYQRFALRVVAS